MTTDDVRNDPEWEPLVRAMDWLKEHGWDKIGSDEFRAFLKNQNLDEKIAIYCCNMPREI